MILKDSLVKNGIQLIQIGEYSKAYKGFTNCL